jgi:outer membrane receptor for ferrienterochelin and colicins
MDTFATNNEDSKRRICIKLNNTYNPKQTMLKRTLLLMLLTTHAFAQHTITGTVVERMSDMLMSIPGASIGVSGTTNYVVSDANGNFRIDADTMPVTLITSFIGYKTDTTLVTTMTNITIVLKKSVDLQEVNVQGKRDATVVSTTKTRNMEKITTKELLRAACCNLSEAFETNPSVNVAYKDAVTGVKEIQMLGLSGTYVQMMAENIPDMRGLAGIYGLTFVPGPWIESIQVSKGSGSVVNGYESTTGQINIEYKKPLDKELPKYYFNLFADELGAVEANIILKKKLSQHWGTLLMLHGRNMQTENDRNNDGFMDIPNSQTVNIYNRYEYHNNEKLEGQIAFKLLADDNNGGQIESSSITRLYQSQVKTRRAEVVGKLGFIFPEKPHKSFGNIFQATVHDMKSAFGDKVYNANERSFFYEGIYANMIKTTDHEYKAGVSFRHNNLEQHFAGLPDRVEENIPGVFAEYTYSHNEKLTLIFGGRADLQDGNRIEAIPRFHGKYNFTENLILRFSAGKSYRTPYIIADHLSVLASARSIVITEDINPERAWNYGLNLTKRFKTGEHEHTLSIDAYRTDFINQLVVDTYSDSTRIQYYNLNGQSYSNSLQATVNIELMETLALRLGYKIEDVKSTFNGVLEQLPLVAKNRALGTIAWSTKDEHWKVDYTLSWEGTKKLQNTFTANDATAVDYSPSFIVMNLQVSKAFRKFELYGGAENMLDYRQQDPIIHPEDPFGNSFDATNIWGPVQGRRIYAGIRLSFN